MPTPWSYAPRTAASTSSRPAIKLTDLDSRHGTFVNQQRILPARSGPAPAADILHLGAGGPEVEEFDFDATPIPATPPPTPAKIAKKPHSYRLLAVGALILLIAASCARPIRDSLDGRHQGPVVDAQRARQLS